MSVVWVFTPGSLTCVAHNMHYIYHCKLPVWWCMYHRIKSDTYRSTECFSNWRGGGITALIMWVFFWRATLNLKHWRNVEAMQPWDAKRLSLTICITQLARLHHLGVVTYSVDGPVSVTDGCCVNSQNLYIWNKRCTSLLGAYKHPLVKSSSQEKSGMNETVEVWLWRHPWRQGRV